MQKKPKFFFVIFTLMFLFTYADAYTQDWIWAKSIKGGGSQEARGIGVDSIGNIYIVGMFYDTLEIDTDTILSQGVNDIFLIKLDADGNILWYKIIGGSGSDGALCSYTDNAGNTYISGYAGNNTIFGEDTLPNSDYICKIESNGNILWVNYAVSNSGVANILAIAVDDSDNVYVTGYFNGLYSIDGETMNQISGTNDVFVIKLDNLGNYIWHRNFGSTDNGVNDTEGAGIGIDENGLIYVVGHTEGNINFDGIQLNGTTNDIIVFTLNSNGNVVHARRHGGAFNEQAMSVLVEENGTHYIGGFYSDICDFGGISLTSTGNYDTDLFIAKYDSIGILQWVKGGGGYSGGIVYSIIKGDSNIYIGGYYGNTTTLGTFVLNGSADPFIAKLDFDGNFLNAKDGRGNGQDQLFDIAYAFNGNVVGTGYYFDSIVFNNYNLPSADFSQNCFIVKYGDISVNIQSNEIAGFPIKIFPNPTSNTVNIELKEPMHLKVYNTVGQTFMKEMDLKIGVNIINGFSNARGIYVFELANYDNRYVTKVIIEK